MSKVIFLRDAQIQGVVYSAGQIIELPQEVAQIATSCGAAREHEQPGPKEFKKDKGKKE